MKTYLRLMINFTVYGDPKAQKRHRHFRRGNFTQSYDPSSEEKQDFLWAAMKYKPKTPLEGPLDFSATFIFPRPKSHFRTGKFSNEMKPNAPHFHTSKPDGDNLVKLVMDAMNKTFWKDDAQLSVIGITKIYGETPQIQIQIDEL